jgi:hypothetical protein
MVDRRKICLKVGVNGFEMGVDPLNSTRYINGRAASSDLNLLFLSIMLYPGMTDGLAIAWVVYQYELL